MAQILLERHAGVARLTIHHPERRNAMTHAMFLELARLFAVLGADDETRVVLLIGHGENFSAGGDISQFGALRKDSASNDDFVAAVDGALTAPTHCAKPVVAAIRGACMGGALELSAGCDVRIAAETAAFRMPAARLSAAYRFEGIRRFVAVVGPAHTADLFFSARKFDAAEAMRIGYVNRVVPDAELESEALAYCRKVAQNAPLTLAAAKVAIREALKDAHERDMSEVRTRIAACFGTEDQQEGRRAFLEKRDPVFRGR